MKKIPPQRQASTDAERAQMARFFCARKSSALPARFWDKVRVDFATGCWEWMGGRDTAGYGVATINKTFHRVHRAAWTDGHGSIEDGKHIDHKCRNRACINLDHLHLVTPAENAQHRAGIRGGTSKYRGVSFYKRTGRWTAQGRLNYKVYRLGYFDTEEEAAEVARQWRLEHYSNSLIDKRVA